MKHRSLCVVLGVAAMVASGLDPARAQDRAAVSIGVVVDGPWERNAEILDLFPQEITALQKQRRALAQRRSTIAHRRQHGRDGDTAQN